jgi:hypothetical protein
MNGFKMKTKKTSTHLTKLPSKETIKKLENIVHLKNILFIDKRDKLMFDKGFNKALEEVEKKIDERKHKCQYSRLQTHIKCPICEELEELKQSLKELKEKK